MKDVHLKAVTFVVNSDDLHGHYFYDSPYDSDVDHIHGVKELTLPKAIKKAIELGLNPYNNFKMFIRTYYF